MDDILIKVTTEELLEASSRVHALSESLRGIFGAIEDCICASSAYWEGNGNRAYVAAYLKKKDNINTILNCFDENATNLEEIAGVYQKAEESVKEVSELLPTDLIF